MMTNRRARRAVFISTLFSLVLSGCSSMQKDDDGGRYKRRCCNLLVDGDFEYRADAIIFPPGWEGQLGGATLDQLRWMVHTGNTVDAIGLFHDEYSTVNKLFHPTPDGKAFAYIGVGPSNGNLPPYPNCTLSQDIAAPLEKGKHYSIWFLQSAFGDSKEQHGDVEGHVRVEVAPTGGGAVIYTQGFEVPSGLALGASGTPWRKQTGNRFTVPDTRPYTIKFISDDSTKAAVVDAVSLCRR